LTLRHVAARLPVVDHPERIIATWSRTVALAALAVLLLGAGCTSGIDLLGDGDHDVVPPVDAGADADADVVADGDAEADVAVETDAEAEAEIDIGADADDGDAVADEGDTDAGTCVDGWYDPTSGLCWENPPDETVRNWADSVAYCDGLVLGGHDDWHTPTISELRSFIRGCPPTETDGTCGVTDGCFGSSCSAGCLGCPLSEGPATGGVYWPLDVSGRNLLGYWSSTPYADGPTYYAWWVDFRFARVIHYPVEEMGHIRCVRPGP
jgi:hypothetical protein